MSGSGSSFRPRPEAARVSEASLRLRWMIGCSLALGERPRSGKHDDDSSRDPNRDARRGPEGPSGRRPGGRADDRCSALARERRGRSAESHGCSGRRSERRRRLGRRAAQLRGRREARVAVQSVVGGRGRRRRARGARARAGRALVFERGWVVGGGRGAGGRAAGCPSSVGHRGAQRAGSGGRAARCRRASRTVAEAGSSCRTEGHRRRRDGPGARAADVEGLPQSNDLGCWGRRGAPRRRRLDGRIFRDER